MNSLEITTFSEGIYGIYKPVAITPAQAINLIKEQVPTLKNSRLTYAGRLDPMAEGLLLILDSQIIKNKDEFLKLDKTYVAEILIGTSTDSFDLLGLPKLKIPQGDVTHTQAGQILKSFNGKTTLPLPPYSSPPLNGKPLFIQAQTGKINEDNTPKRTTTIHSIHLNSISIISPASILNYIKTTVPKVVGDFRNNAIIKEWGNILQQQNKFQVMSITISASHGTYIRSLAHTFGKILGAGACIYKLKRTRIGNYCLVK